MSSKHSLFSLGSWKVKELICDLHLYIGPSYIDRCYKTMFSWPIMQMVRGVAVEFGFFLSKTLKKTLVFGSVVTEFSQEGNKNKVVGYKEGRIHCTEMENEGDINLTYSKNVRIVWASSRPNMTMEQVTPIILFEFQMIY